MTDRATIIAEAGVNHNGSLDLALRLVDLAADADADIVKFQTFRADAIATPSAPRARYQAANTGDANPQLAMLRALELDEQAHFKLLQHCRDVGIRFLSTPFDHASLRFLVETLRVDALKIGSGEITNGPLLLAAARTGLPTILSTGMSTLSEIETALAVLAFGYCRPQSAEPRKSAFDEAYCEEEGQQALRQKATLLHCTTEYPAAFEDANLRAMDTLAAAFGVRVGLSDHTPGIAAAVAAVARGACMIEKHFTLDRGMPGPDHKASLAPAELKQLVRMIREVEASLGTARKRPSPAERSNIPVARRVLVAARDIAAGERLSEENVSAKRAGAGISPMRFWEIQGRPARRAYRENEALDE